MAIIRVEVPRRVSALNRQPARSVAIPRVVELTSRSVRQADLMVCVLGLSRGCFGVRRRLENSENSHELIANMTVQLSLSSKGKRTSCLANCSNSAATRLMDD